MNLTWTDVQGDMITVADEATVADLHVIASVLITSENRREEAAVWMTRENAADLHAWLEARL